MRHDHHYESTGRVIAVALSFFGGLVLLGSADGVFERLGAELTLMIVAFGVTFGALTWHLDAGVRSYVKRLFAPRAIRGRTQAT